MSKKVFSFYILFILSLLIFPLILSSCSDGKSSYLYTAKKNDINEIVITCFNDPYTSSTLTSKDHINGFLDLFPNKKVKFIESKSKSYLDCETGCEKSLLDKEEQFTTQYSIAIISGDEPEYLCASELYISINNIDYEKVEFKESILSYIKSIHQEILMEAINNASSIHYNDGTEQTYPELLTALKSTDFSFESVEDKDFFSEISYSYFYLDDDTSNYIYYRNNEYYFVFDTCISKIIGLDYSFEQN